MSLLRLFISTCALSFLLTSCDNKSPAADSPAGITVKFAQVEALPWRPTIKTSGNVSAIKHVELRNEVPGRILAVGASSGETVKANQLLFQLDDTQERAQRAALTIELELAEQDFVRAGELKKQGVMAVEAYERSLALRNMKVAQIEALNALIAKKTILAPFDGRVGLHKLVEGQYLDQGTVITHLVSDTPQLWVDFSLPQTLPTLALNSEVTLFRPEETTPFSTGSVIAVNPALTGRARFSQYRAVFEAQGSNVTPGSLIFVNVPSGPARDVWSVPSLSVQYDLNGAYLYTVKNVGGTHLRASRKRIAVLESREDFAVVDADMDANTLVITEGAFKLYEDAPVTSSEQEKQEKIRQTESAAGERNNA